VPHLRDGLIVAKMGIRAQRTAFTSRSSRQEERITKLNSPFITTVRSLVTNGA